MATKPKAYRIILAEVGGDLVSEWSIEIDGETDDLVRTIGEAITKHGTITDHWPRGDESSDSVKV